MTTENLQELQRQFKKMKKTYILECHTKYGVDYKLFKLDKTPTKKQSKYLYDFWQRECSEMFGMTLKEIKEDDRIFTEWYGEGLGKPIGTIPSAL